MFKIGFLPTSFEVDRREAGNITVRLLSKEISKENETYIFIGNIRNKKKIETFGDVKVVRLSKIYPLESIKKPVLFLKGFYTHIFASRNSFKKYNLKKKLKLDIVHGFSASSVLVLRTLLVKRLNKGSKAIHTFKSNSAFLELSLIEKYLFSKLDGIIIQDQKWKKRLYKLKVPKSKIHFIKSPINLENFYPIKNKTELKEKHGFSKNQKLVLYYGHFNQHKGVEYLISSLKYLKDVNFKLVLIPSNDEDSKRYVDIIKKEGVADKILIKPATSPILEYLNMAESLVLPYPHLNSTESNPSCLFESLACETPVITSDLVEIKEFVSHKKTAYLAKPKNPKSIADAIREVLSNKKLRIELSNNGKSIPESFDYKKIAKQYIEVYNKIKNNN